MTAVEVATTHEWRLVAPWWTLAAARNRRTRTIPGAPDDRRSVRVSRPVLQMYDSPDLVNVFLADPQRRLSVRPRHRRGLGRHRRQPRDVPAAEPDPPPQALPRHTPPALPGGGARCTATPRGSRTSGTGDVPGRPGGPAAARRPARRPAGRDGPRRSASTRSPGASGPAWSAGWPAMRPGQRRSAAVGRAGEPPALAEIGRAGRPAIGPAVGAVRRPGTLPRGLGPDRTGRGGQSRADAGLRHRAAADRAGGRGTAGSRSRNCPRR